MKSKYLKITKSLGWNMLSYHSYWSDMRCRCVDIMVEKNGHIISDDFGYWCDDYHKILALELFKYRLEDHNQKFIINT